MQRARRDVANADVARPGTAKTATWRRARYRRIRAFRLTAFDPWDDEVHLEVRIDVVVELEHDEVDPLRPSTASGFWAKT